MHFVVENDKLLRKLRIIFFQFSLSLSTFFQRSVDQCFVAVFRHKHEMETGRTSSVGNDILGFDQMGQVVNKSDGHGQSFLEPYIVVSIQEIWKPLQLLQSYIK